MERDFWLPNLSGEVFGRERLQACLEGYSSDDFELTLNENVVMTRSKPSSFLIPASFELIMTIPVDDPRGSCHLNCNLDSTALNIFVANKAWKEFRSILDGCYGAVYNCTGMDEPFNKFHKMQSGYLHGICDDDCRDIANRFIQSVEQSSDAMNYLWKELSVEKSKNHEKVAHESLAKAESNRLYFDSFISLYSDRFDPEWLEKKKREMELRIGKARVAYSTIYKERRNEYEHTTIRVAMIALGVSVIATIANLIVSFL